MNKRDRPCKFCGKLCFGTVCRSCFCKDKWRTNYRFSQRSKEGVK